MIDVLSKLRNIQKKMQQEMRREPTTEEISIRAGFSLDEVKRVMDIGRHPVSLDRPVGEGDDCSFGEFIEDGSSDNPIKNASNGILRDKLEGLLKTLTYREREIVRQSHPRTSATDRSESASQVAAPCAEPAA
jgi:RNA polymerase primary sigma factor